MTEGAGHRYVTAVESIYAAASAPEAWPAALQAIADITGDIGANLAYRRDDGSVGVIVSPGLEASGKDYPAWQHLDIRFARLAERGYLITSDAFSDRHVASDQEVETHPFYVGFLAAHGLKWVMATGISPDPKVAAIVAVQRASDRAAFSDDELEGLARIGRHVENALRLSIRLAGLEATNAALADALSRLDLGVFLVDGLGRAVAGNAAAATVIGQGLVLHNGRLVARDPLDRAVFEAALERASLPDTEDRPPQALLLRDGETVLVVHVLPVHPGSQHRFADLLLDTRAIVLVRPSAPGTPPDPTVLRDLFDLTLSEARLAALVGTGLTPRQAAGELGISEETARTVLKRVFAKTGVSRQSELAGLMARLALR